MTCIVAIVEDGVVTMGADSLSSDVRRYDVRILKTPKLFENGPFLIGYTTSWRMGQLLQYRLGIEVRHPDTDATEFMATTFVDAVRRCLKEGGWAEKEKEQETGGTFLVGYEGHLFYVQDDYSVLESADGFDACGSGDRHALAALHATGGKSARERITLALEAAERFTAYVRRPWHILEQPPA